MPYQLIPEPPVEKMELDSVTPKMFDVHAQLYAFGYRGSFSTTTHDNGDGTFTESGRFDMVMDNAVPVSASLGDVILYRTSPLAVVKCVSADEAAKYQPV